MAMKIVYELRVLAQDLLKQFYPYYTMRNHSAYSLLLNVNQFY